MSDVQRLAQELGRQTSAPGDGTYLRRGLVTGVDRALNTYTLSLGGATIASVPSNMVAAVGDSVDVLFDGPSARIVGVQGLMIWRSVTYLNGWSDFGGGYWPVGCARDSEGFVHLRGLCKGGSLNAYMFTLPVGYRSSSHSIFTTASAGTPVVITVELNGNVYVPASAGATNGNVSVDGVLFPVA